MKLGSLFDGSGGFPLAGVLNGVEPVWASEIEPYPIAVTKSRFPNMKHLGSVTNINGAEIEPADIITFGSPCQDLSIAGKRAGIHDGERSNLFFEAIRIVKEMRQATDDEYPKYAIWENVPGAFSSNKGEDFRCVLEALSEAAGGDISIPRPANGKWSTSGEIVADNYSIAWRTFDAQYWGVPQRRRRIYLVADFRGQRAGEILFEQESLRRNSTESREAWESVADDAGGGTERSDRVRCLNTPIAFMAGQGAKAGGIGAVEDGSPTLRGTPSGSNQIPTIVCPQQFHTLTATNARCVESAQQPNCIAIDCRNLTANIEISGTLQAKNNGGYSLNYQNPICYFQQKFGDYIEGCGTLTTSNDPSRSSGNVVRMAHGQQHAEIYDNLSPCLTCKHEQPIVSYDAVSRRKYIVRRLTPLECNRLQGFPDNWGTPNTYQDISDYEYQFWEQVREDHSAITGKRYTPFKTKDQMIRWLNKLHTDTAEYKMWGNGIALPCANYVMNGIVKIERTRNEQQ